MNNKRADGTWGGGKKKSLRLNRGRSAQEHPKFTQIRVSFAAASKSFASASVASISVGAVLARHTGICPERADDKWQL